MLPPAPGRLSTTTCAFHASASRCAAARAMMSVAPPGGNGTTMRIGWLGYAACARAVRVASATGVAASAAMTVRRFILFPPRRGAAVLVDLGAAGFHDLGVLVALPCDECCEFLRRHRRGLGALRQHLLTHVRRVERLDDLG